MSKEKTNLFTNPYAETRLQPMSIAGQEVEKVGLQVKDDAGEWNLAGTHSTDYPLITNEFAKDVADNIFHRSGYEFEEMKTLWNGKRFIQFYASKNPIAEGLHFGVMLRNSYDGSGKFGLEHYLLNPDCTNRYIDRNRFGFFAISHRANQQINMDDALAQLEAGSRKLIEAAPRIMAMKNVDLEISHITSACRNTKFPPAKWHGALKQLDKEREKGKLFGLYQALTYVATHELSGFNSITIGNTITEWALGKENYLQYDNSYAEQRMLER